MVKKESLTNMSAQKFMLGRAGVTLTEDESVVVVASVHDSIYWKGVAVIVLGMLLLIGVFFQNLGFLLMFVGVIMLALAHLSRRFLVLAATNKRIFVRSGYVYTDMIELRYSQVESVELGITPIGQIFGYGSVILSGTGQRRVIVPFIKDAIGFRRQINDILVNK